MSLPSASFPRLLGNQCSIFEPDQIELSDRMSDVPETFQQAPFLENLDCAWLNLQTTSTVLQGIRASFVYIDGMSISRESDGSRESRYPSAYDRNVELWHTILRLSLIMELK